ncbi:MAG: hypothetical protein U9R58_03120 [Chloroflexota bacterium]|nr:hypothetical protein [Chloroflexota bacterium]
MKQTLLYLCISLFLVGCQYAWSQPIPDGDIVYMTFSDGIDELGFVNPDGSDNQIIEIDEKFAKPVWSNDGKILYGLSGSAQAGAYGGHPAYWDLERGYYRICTGRIPFYYQIQGSDNADNPYEVIIMRVREIIVMDLDKCEQVQTLVDYSAYPNYEIEGFSYSSSRQELVYGLVVNPYKNPKYKIMLLDIKTGEKKQLAEGINPSWSLDGTKIAYLGLDGLYVILSNGEEPRQLSYRQPTDLFRYRWGPLPRWSPDGEWLVYHRCIKEQEYCLLEYEWIYKIRTSDGAEECIAAGGKYPSWRP